MQDTNLTWKKEPKEQKLCICKMHMTLQFAYGSGI